MINDAICHLRCFLTAAESGSSLHLNKKRQETLMNLLVEAFASQKVIHDTVIALFTSHAIHAFPM